MDCSNSVDWWRLQKPCNGISPSGFCLSEAVASFTIPFESKNRLFSIENFFKKVSTHTLWDYY